MPPRVKFTLKRRNEKLCIFVSIKNCLDIDVPLHVLHDILNNMEKKQKPIFFDECEQYEHTTYWNPKIGLHVNVARNIIQHYHYGFKKLSKCVWNPNKKFTEWYIAKPRPGK